MDPTERILCGLPEGAAFSAQLKAAFRGGAIMLAGSGWWALVTGKRTDFFMGLWGNWLPCAWLVFALGGLLGCLLPRWVARRGLVATLGVGVAAGAVVGLIVAFGSWVCLNHRDLVGLVTNRASGGYASYSLSVRQQLSVQAWRMFTGVAPRAAAWVVAWTVLTNRFPRPFAVAVPATSAAVPGISLRADRQLLRLVAWLAGGFAVLAMVTMGLTWLTPRSAPGSAVGLLLVGPVAAGLVVLGPWLGPLLNPGGGFIVAWHWTLVALPVLLAGFAPFLLVRRPVRPLTAVTAWCGVVTALLFWTAVGAMSLGWSLG